MIPQKEEIFPTLFVISAPSGTGKTTLLKLLLKKIKTLRLSVSHTTRTPRNNERNGIDYNFVSKHTFDKLIQKGEFIEWAEVYNDKYGTSYLEIEKAKREKKDLILDIDVKGARAIKEIYPQSVLIFILPPSLKTLKQRLKKRDTESVETIKRRIEEAKKEISHFKRFDYILVNEDLDHALRELESIVIAEGCRRSKRTNLAQRLLK